MTPSISEVTPLDYTRYDFKDPETYKFRTLRGLSRSIVEQISKLKNEPAWMLEYRLRAYQHFLDRPMPDWGPSLDELDFDGYTYYANPLNEGGDEEEVGGPSGRYPQHLREAWDPEGGTGVLRRRWRAGR